MGKKNLLLITTIPNMIIKKPPQKEAYKRPTGPKMTQKTNAAATLLKGSSEDVMGLALLII